MDDDAFSIRMNFKQMLETINPTSRVINEIMEYCLLHRSKHALYPAFFITHRYLITCITEHMASAPVLERVNLLYVIDSICTMSKKRGYTEYPAIVGFLLLKISKLICPDDQASGDLNAPALKKVLDK
jgi:hypothetical protein